MVLFSLVVSFYESINKSLQIEQMNIILSWNSCPFICKRKVNEDKHHVTSMERPQSCLRRAVRQEGFCEATERLGNSRAQVNGTARVLVAGCSPMPMISRRVGRPEGNSLVNVPLSFPRDFTALPIAIRVPHTNIVALPYNILFTLCQHTIYTNPYFLLYLLILRYYSLFSLYTRLTIKLILFCMWYVNMATSFFI